MPNQQIEVYDAVIARGYMNGYNEYQMFARQVAKLQEELGELAEQVNVPLGLSLSIEVASARARQEFDRKRQSWGLEPDASFAQIRKELTDLQVVLFCAACTLEQMTGEPFDIAEAAREKARKDIKRGVR
jgi:NTP pyrophosphatase (non-canonical NTP hydrolase)